MCHSHTNTVVAAAAAAAATAVVGAMKVKEKCVLNLLFLE